MTFVGVSKNFRITGIFGYVFHINKSLNRIVFGNIDYKMGVSSGVSLALSSIFSVLLFSAMQMYRPFFAATQINTIIGGFLGSWLFVLALTAVSNMESVVLGSGFQAKLFPEIVFCLIGATFACGMIHRVCASTCFMFSLLALYYVNRLSQKAQNATTAQPDAHTSKKKRK